MNTDTIPYTSCSIHPNQINVYYSSINPKGRFSVHGSIPEQFKSNDHQNKISHCAYKKLSRAIDYLVYNAQSKRLPKTYHGKGLLFKISFITLTLSSTQIHSDQKIKSYLFNQFLIEMQVKWKVRSYIWRAEKQKNGNIHFHILCDKFIPWNDIRNTWNRIQQKLGYVTRYRENRMLWHRGGFHYDQELKKTWSLRSQKRAYIDGMRTDWQNPNSTDIHSIRYISRVNSYFKKYMSKQGGEVGVSGRLWGCSVNLSNISGAKCDVDSSIERELIYICKKRDILVYNHKWFTIIYCNIDDLKDFGCFLLLTLFHSYIESSFT